MYTNLADFFYEFSSPLFLYISLQNGAIILTICYIVNGGFMKIEDLKFDQRNYRRHNDRNKELIKKSIE